jgi:hypothetical protein
MSRKKTGRSQGGRRKSADAQRGKAKRRPVPKRERKSRAARRSRAKTIEGAGAKAQQEWTIEKMAALGRLHAELEANGPLEPLLSTLAPDPVYEFHPLRRCMRGDDRVRRFYEQFFARFLSLRHGFELVAEWVGLDSVAQEYDISLRVDGAIEHFRVLGILYARGDKLGGERVYASERFIRLLTGPLFDELEPLE